MRVYATIWEGGFGYNGNEHLSNVYGFSFSNDWVYPIIGKILKERDAVAISTKKK